MSSCLGIFFPPREQVTQQDFFLRGCSAAKRVEDMVHFKAPKIEPKVFCFQPHFDEQTRFILGPKQRQTKERPLFSLFESETDICSCFKKDTKKASMFLPSFGGQKDSIFTVDLAAQN